MVLNSAAPRRFFQLVFSIARRSLWSAKRFLLTVVSEWTPPKSEVTVVCYLFMLFQVKSLMDAKLIVRTIFKITDEQRWLLWFSSFSNVFKNNQFLKKKENWNLKKRSHKIPKHTSYSSYSKSSQQNQLQFWISFKTESRGDYPRYRVVCYYL